MSLMKHVFVIDTLQQQLIALMCHTSSLSLSGQAFTHLIKHYHQENHKLVTHGVYQFVRHPGYSGFFIWAVGTQFMLCNPLSTVAFAIVVWRFFALRIPYEEFYLRQFFGSEYEDYARRVPSGIPFVK
ncbi:probable protein-S-isoprenylcysteine O-methyltransferase isoform X2 [Coffea arabica]|uniref:Protein-S-isoprenylcysteine O-methyltransferase n=1 Tax=Coffea arabica TaxID=13443 RepID=A0A6P6UZB4_COFAR|nr:probable protein-S-isoprenylcysteine O-methyltransferase isoform X3 [Coffea arabica]